MKSILLFLLLIFGAYAHAEEPVLGELPQEICLKDRSVGNDQVNPIGDEYQHACVLFFEFFDDDYDGKKLETTAYVLLNGRVTTIHRVGRESRKPNKPNPIYPSEGSSESYTFKTEDKAATVTLNATVAQSSCRADNDGSCCGDTYKGTLAVTTASGHFSMPIQYYRGG